MPNNQAHDPRVSDPLNRLAQAVGLSVAALSASSSAIDQGSQTVISGSGFGSKAQAAPVLWDAGTEVYENGTKNTYREGLTDGALITDTATEANELYEGLDSPKLVITSRTQRHSGSTGHYIGSNTNGAVSVGKPKAAGGSTPAVHSKHYQAWWIKYGYHYQKMHSFEYSGKTGSFQLPDLTANPNALGEQLTLNNGETAYIIRDTGTRICIYTPNSTARMNELAATSITGQTSGASLTVADNGIYTDDHSGPEKVARVWNGDGVSGTDFRYTWNQTASATVGTGQSSAGTPYINDSTMAGENQWALLECIVDLDARIVSVVADGNKIDLDISGYSYATNKGLYFAHIGWQAVRTLYNVIEFGEIYLDHSFSRVYIGDAPTWGACTLRELQRPTAWADDQVTTANRFGQLPGTKYAYVVTDAWPADATEGLLVGAQ